MLSIIIPSYNEEKMIQRAADTINTYMSGAGIDCDIFFVDDGSRDATWQRIEEVCGKYGNVTGLHFSRNFGKEAAMFAGLEAADGECVAVLDCDLQHPPEKLIEMYRLWEQGAEVVEGVKEDRGDESAAHRFAANTFYRLISGATGMDMANASDFKLLDRKVVDTLNALPERKVFFRALSYWVGYRKEEVTYRVAERTEGESKWSTGALIRYAVTNKTSFSSMPLHIITGLGAVMLLISLVLGITALVQKICGTALGGFTTVILISLFSGSVIMISLGILGFYIERIYEEIKGRPRYIISGTCGKGDKA